APSEEPRYPAAPPGRKTRKKIWLLQGKAYHSLTNCFARFFVSRNKEQTRHLTDLSTMLDCSNRPTVELIASQNRITRR
ncbi:MAG TPA: hypothetical protein DCW39_07680, partial [Betaproteobacteria bacterium]|nr:hypothetical protein [Betaproteobacteria bacterium]